MKVIQKQRLRKFILSILVFFVLNVFHCKAIDTVAVAKKSIELAKKCISQAFPYKSHHVSIDSLDANNHLLYHPVFYGCFDWHSAVHAHWLLLKLFNEGFYTDTAEFVQLFNYQFTNEKLQKETEYFNLPLAVSFERTYGWAWILKLSVELNKCKLVEANSWKGAFLPLEKKVVSLYKNFLPKQMYAIRTGVHPNTAFGLLFALDYCEFNQNTEFKNLLIERAKFYYINDKNCSVSYEPSGEDFFSPCLMEANLMSKVLAEKEFSNWFNSFVSKKEFAQYYSVPATVTDRTDGKLVHLDGLNLSRAWCMNNLPHQIIKKYAVTELSKRCLESGISKLSSGDYMGEHWLGTFAILALFDF